MSENGKTDYYELPYSGNICKKIAVWTPPGYTKEKQYGAIYMTDGQNLYGDKAPYDGGWRADEAVMLFPPDGTGGCLIVGIDNGDSRRDSELTPDLGEVSRMIAAIDGHVFSERTGDYFAEFVVNKVMPFVNARYSTFCDRRHTAVAGSSSGGLEAFYIGMQYSDKFGYIAALSPAFILFEEKVWLSYFNTIDLAKKDCLPFLFMSNGAGEILEQLLLNGTRKMVSRLKEFGYPDKRIKYIENEHDKHNEPAWRTVFVQALDWFFDSYERQEY